MHVKLFLSLASIAVFAIACNDNSNGIDVQGDSASTLASDTLTSMPAIDSSHTTTCYGDASPKDSVWLQITRNGKVISGSLFIQREGKDQNNGTLQGTINGDTLFAD